MLCLAVPANDARAQSDGVCEDRYAEAETAYLEARFDDAIRPLEDCLRSERVGTEDEVRVRRLLAFAYLGRDGSDSAEARRVVEALLTTDPAYTADQARDRPDFAVLVDEVRSSREVSERQPEPTRRASDGGRGVGGWLLAAVGVVVVVVAAVLLGSAGGGGDHDDDDD